jgi:hypothetical protein
MRRPLRALFTLVLVALCCVGDVTAQMPTLDRLTPIGAQRGTEVTLQLDGKTLGGALDLVFDRAGLRVVSLESVSSERARVVLAIAADAPLGPHAVRVRTQRGLSNLLTFQIGRLPVVAEVEPNGGLAEAQALALGGSVHGAISGEDEDLFALDVRRGTSVRAVALGVQLGNSNFDPLIELVAEDGALLACGDDDPLSRRDAVLELSAPRDGRMFVRVRDAARGASREARYILHVDAGAQPRAVRPLAIAAPPSEAGAAAIAHAPRMLLGPAGPLGTATPRAEDLGPLAGWMPRGTTAWWPEASLAPLLLRVSSLATTQECEPNDRSEDAQALVVPGTDDVLHESAFEGTLEAPGDIDVVQLDLQKGEVIELSLWARRLRSPLDGILEVRGPDDRETREDDNDGLDPVLRFTAREAGKHTITVSDHMGRGGPAFVYRLEAQRPAPRLSATLVGTKKELALPRGGRAFVALTPELVDFDGALQATLEALPDGVVAHTSAEPMRGGQPVVVLQADADAPLGHGLATLSLVGRLDGGEVRGGLADQVVLAPGRNNTVLAAQSVQQLAMAVVERAPFDVALEVPRVPLPRSSRVDVVVRVTRDSASAPAEPASESVTKVPPARPAFEGPLTVGLVGLPPGVRAPSTLRVEPGVDTATFTLEIAGDARLGAGALVAFAEGTVEGVLVRTATTFAPVEVVAPLVTAKLRAAEIERTGTSSLHVELELPQSSGATVGGASAVTLEFTDATATLVGLPHDVTVSSTAVTAPALVLPLAAGPKASLGLHRGLVLEVRLAFPGGVVVQTQGGAELRVKDVPTVTVTPTFTDTSAAGAAPPPTLSRRERLRAEHEARLAAEAASADAARGDTLRAAYDAFGSLPDGNGDVTDFASTLEPRPTPTFKNDVLPILTARGCNAGACHGASQGQDGFHLSLFGFDAAGDHARIVAERFGRRIEPAFPDQSLLLTKATLAVPHTGGAVLAPGDADYVTLRAWIAAGAPADPTGLPTVTGLALEPSELVLRGQGTEATLTVHAHYSDGTRRDVTRLALLRTDNAASARIAPDGMVRAGAPGKAFLTASFASETLGVPVVVHGAEEPAEWRDPADAAGAVGVDGFSAISKTWIDELIERELQKLRVTPLPLVDDGLYLRRVSLDLIGRLPTSDERAAFLADPRSSQEKRTALVDSLLTRAEFVDQWVMRLAELLRVRSSNDVAPKAAQGWFEWLQNALRSGVGVDEIVRQQLTASGWSYSVPEVSYFLVERDAKVMAENFAQAFLGVRISCAQCHNHPFDRWTQDDYTGLVAFFAEVRAKRAEDPNEWVVFDRRGGDTRHPITNQVVPPKFLGGEVPDVQRRERRGVLAEWLTAPENPWFARNLANRVWAAYMGNGLVEPVDDVRISNPAANEALLAALAARLVASDYDLGDLAREIVTSRVYQRAASKHLADDSIGEGATVDVRARDEFGAFRVRRLRAETLADVIAQVTGAADDHPRLPMGASATLLADGADGSVFLSTFGRTQRSSVCACEVSDSPSLSQALHLVNGPTVHDKIGRGGVVATLLKGGLGDTEVIEALYTRALSRAPTEVERDALVALVVEAGEARATALEDVFWALVTSNEFLFQH